MGAQGRLWVSNLDGFDIWRSYFWVWQRPFGILHEMFFIMYGENGGPCLTFTLYVSGPSEFSVPIQTFLYRPCQTVPVGAWQASSTISKTCQTRQRPVSSIFICPRSPPCLSSRVRDLLAEAGSQHLFFTLAQSNASAPLIPKVFDAFRHVGYCSEKIGTPPVRPCNPLLETDIESVASAV